MNNSYIIGVSLVLFGIFIAAISQIMLKKSAQKKYRSQIAEYINPLVFWRVCFAVRNNIDKRISFAFYSYDISRCSGFYRTDICANFKFFDIKRAY